MKRKVCQAESKGEEAIVIRMFPDPPGIAERDRSDADEMRRPLRIVIVDDQPFMRDVISKMLRRDERRYNVVAEAANLREARAACDQIQPDLFIIDLTTPAEHGADELRHLVAAFPTARVLLSTAFVADDRALTALRSGAHGFVEKPKTWDHFLEAIERVARGEQYFSAGAESCDEAADEVAACRMIPLTVRQTEVLKLVAEGSSSKEIAQKLGVSVGTVDVHRANLMKKLHVKNIAGLVIFAFHSGLVR